MDKVCIHCLPQQKKSKEKNINTALWLFIKSLAVKDNKFLALDIYDKL